VREAAEPAHDVAVLLGVAEHAHHLLALRSAQLVAPAAEQLDAAILIGERLAVHERHVEEGALVVSQLAIDAERDALGRDLGGPRVAVVRAPGAAEHVARELVEHDDERQPPARRGQPGVALAGGHRLVQGVEAIADELIELGILAPPARLRLGAGESILVQLAEPEAQHLLHLAIGRGHRVDAGTPGAPPQCDGQA
jgi:hypothetical protein